jgi:hypothetical protein
MTAQTIEITLHTSQRRQARLPGGATRERLPLRLIVLPAPGSARAVTSPGWLPVPADQRIDDLDQVSWEDAEWR